MSKVWHRKQNGWWYATIRRDNSRKQVRLHQGPDNREHRLKPEQELHILLAERPPDEGDDTPSWLTVGHVVTGFLAHSRNDHDLSTADWYRDLLKPFGERFGRLKLRQLRKRHVLGYAKQHFTNPTSHTRTQWRCRIV